MARIKRTIQYPEGWVGSTEAEKEQWAAEANMMLADQGVVPHNSLQSFATAWQYERGRRATRRGGLDEDFQEAGDNQVVPVEAVT